MQLAWLFTLSEFRQRLAGSDYDPRLGRPRGERRLPRRGQPEPANPNSAESEPDPNFERPESTG